MGAWELARAQAGRAFPCRGPAQAGVPLARGPRRSCRPSPQVHQLRDAVFEHGRQHVAHLRPRETTANRQDALAWSRHSLQPHAAVRTLPKAILPAPQLAPHHVLAVRAQALAIEIHLDRAAPVPADRGLGCRCARRCHARRGGGGAARRVGLGLVQQVRLHPRARACSKRMQGRQSASMDCQKWERAIECRHQAHGRSWRRRRGAPASTMTSSATRPATSSSCTRRLAYHLGERDERGRDRVTKGRSELLEQAAQAVSCAPNALLRL